MNALYILQMIGGVEGNPFLARVCCFGALREWGRTLWDEECWLENERIAEIWKENNGGLFLRNRTQEENMSSKLVTIRLCS